jgi:hypothetical protein
MENQETPDLFKILKEGIFRNMADIWVDPEAMNEDNKKWVESLIDRWMALEFSPSQVRLIEDKYSEPFAQYDMCSEELLSFFERLVADGLMVSVMRTKLMG